MDLGVEIPARNELVVDTRLSTSVAVGQARVSTIEHVMAALLGMGIMRKRKAGSGTSLETQ